jgi:hypothetical protein
MPAAFLTGVLDALIERCTTDPDAVVAARAEFDERRGQVFEDEDAWETRTAIFLEYFATERADPATGVSPAVSGAREVADERERAALAALGRSYRCLAEIIAIEPGRVVIADRIGNAHIEINERPGLPGVSVGDIAELRICAFESGVHLTPGILWHPPGTQSALRRHVADLVAAGAGRTEICDFAASLMIRSLRYGHREPSEVYRTATPDRFRGKVPPAR